MNKNKQNKALAAVLATSILVTGTFAWQSFSQYATNETITHGGLAGGRLHNYFFQGDEATTGYDRVQEVFVENYAGVQEYDEDGNPVASSNPNEFTSELYARVKLSEFLEYGYKAGYSAEHSEDVTGKDVTNVRGTDPNMLVTPEIDDKSTWDVYKWDTDSAIQQYRTLEFGGMNGNAGSTAYMPTFNQDHTSDDTQLNGSLEGTDTNRHDEATAYLDYTFYEEGDLESDVLSFYDLDEDAPDTSGDEVYHKAQPTEVSTGVISMEDWLESPAPGDFWVYDEDGWAYWANPIKGNSATGLLLSGITEEKTVDGTATYYAVHVEAQLATAGAWENEDELSDILGIEGDNVTEEGLFLLNLISAETELFTQPTTSLTAVTGKTVAEIDALVGTEDTVTVDGIEYYVLDRETQDKYYTEDLAYGTKDAVLLYATQYVELPETSVSYYNTEGVRDLHRTRFHNQQTAQSDWTSSAMRTEVLPAWLSTVPQMDAMAHTTKVITDGYYTTKTETSADNLKVDEITYDAAYLLSNSELFSYEDLEKSARAKCLNTTIFTDGTPGTSGGAWMRSAQTSTKVWYILNSTGTMNDAINVTSNCAIRPIVWVAL